ncbi:MAG: carboxymuconolactone decarboxylase family protein [Chloroflexi bacterium]|nr:MAG: carboxymuconolactone decarboxylase family protein [Chloroflexota bacterium]
MGNGVTKRSVYPDRERRGKLNSMSRIPPVENSDLSLQEGPGTTTMATLFRVMAHRPDVARQSMQLLETTMRTGTVDPKLKELLAIRVSQVNHCYY